MLIGEFIYLQLHQMGDADIFFFAAFSFHLTEWVSTSCFRWRSALLWRTFFTTAVVAVVLRGLIQFCRSGKCGLFGQGGLIMFDLSSTVPSYSTQDIIAIIVLGIIGGVFGGLFNFLLDRILRAYSFINEYVPIMCI
jgi:H+/Cl- antiporter ClcA